MLSFLFLEYPMNLYGNFLTNVVLSPKPDSDSVWILQEDLVYKTSSFAITVPKGFETDLASTPKAIWSLIPPFGLYTEAAVLHDFMYATHPQPFIRKDADDIFYHNLLGAGVNKAKALSMYYAVRLFGGSHWS